jgi:hypothetical protein
VSGAAIRKTVLIGDADNKAFFAAQRVHDILPGRDQALPDAISSWGLMTLAPYSASRLFASALLKPDSDACC